METTFVVEEANNYSILRLQSDDDTNRLQKNCVEKLTTAIRHLAVEKTCKLLVITGNDKFFSAGADLAEISILNPGIAFEFGKMGQELMAAVAEFPAPTYAAISGYCFGGGLDLALACRHRIASPSAIFGHRGAALGLITGWGGTQRLPRLIGKARALEMFLIARTVTAKEALTMGLIDAIADNSLAEATRRASA